MSDTRTSLPIKPEILKLLKFKAVELGKNLGETANIVLDRGLKDMNRPRRKADSNGK